MAEWSVLQERAENWHLNHLFIPASSFTRRIRRELGTDYGEMLTVFHDCGGFAVFAPSNEVKKFENDVLDIVEKDPELVFEFSKRFGRESGEFLEFCSTFRPDDLKKMGLPHLGRLYERYYRTYFEIYTYSEPLPFGFREVLSIKLEKYLKSLLASKNQSGKFGEYFALLTSSPKMPFATREEEKLLELTLEIKADKEFSKILLKDLDGALKLLPKFPELQHKIENHTRNYFWMPFDYAGKLWTLRHFLKTIRDYLHSGFDAGKRLKNLREFYKGLAKRQLNASRKIGIGSHEFMLFKVLQEGAYLIDYKKEQFTKCHVYLKKLEEEIAKKLGISWLQVCYVSPPELVDWCVHGKAIPVDKLNSRMKMCVLYDDGKSEKVFEGPKAKEILAKEGIDFKTIHMPSEIKGLCACAGNITGKARIIRTSKELEKLGDGEILVTFMTTPDFVRGMKVAGAIITDEGGLTSHAAIVSREFGIPCVVGTKIGTKVFKDGDILEVRASHGIVRKVK